MSNRAQGWATAGLILLIVAMLVGVGWWIVDSSQTPNTPVTKRMTEQIPGHIPWAYNGITAVTIHSQGRLVPCIVIATTGGGSSQTAVGITCDWSKR